MARGLAVALIAGAGLGGAVSLAKPAAAEPGCTVSTTLRKGAASAEVQCLEERLAHLGFLASNAVDQRFTGTTTLAVKKFQKMHFMRRTGVVDAATAAKLGLTATGVVAPQAGGHCTASGRSAVVDPEFQRVWLCVDGAMTSGPFPMTTASVDYYRANQGPATYTVYSKAEGVHYRYTDGHKVYMKWMIRYDKSKIGTALGFHSVPTFTFRGTDYVQPLDTVGDLSMRNHSGGCLRLTPDHAKLVYDFLRVGDSVVVVSW